MFEKLKTWWNKPTPLPFNHNPSPTHPRPKSDGVLSASGKECLRSREEALEAGEPVLAILKAMKERPETFKSRVERHGESFTWYRIKDTQIGWEDVICQSHTESRVYSIHNKWLTHDECKVIITGITNLENSRLQLDRQKVMELYK